MEPRIGEANGPALEFETPAAERAHLQAVHDRWMGEYNVGDQPSPGLKALVRNALKDENPEALLVALSGPIALMASDIDPSPMAAYRRAETAVIDVLPGLDLRSSESSLFDAILEVAFESAADTEATAQDTLFPEEAVLEEAAAAEPPEAAAVPETPLSGAAQTESPGEERRLSRTKISFSFQIANGKHIGNTYEVSKFRQFEPMRRLLLGVGFLTTLESTHTKSEKDILVSTVNKGQPPDQALSSEEVDKLLNEALEAGYIRDNGARYSFTAEAVPILKPNEFKSFAPLFEPPKAVQAAARKKEERRSAELPAEGKELVSHMVEEYARMARELGRPSLAGLLEEQYPAGSVAGMDENQLKAAAGYVRPLFMAMRSRYRGRGGE